MTEREIFLEALEMGTPEARAAYLRGVCDRDVILRGRVEELLKEHFSNDSLLAGPALETERTQAESQEAPAQMLGRYKLLEKIGEGGFGEVWMAEQREPVKRRVALKIIKLGMDSRQIVARFEAERQALAMMDHANIAKIFDAGTTDAADSQLSTSNSQLSQGRPYFVMELVRGIKITEYCDQNQLPTKERLHLFIKVCQAIQHAHQKGIIHRDIKPSNILVTLHDGVPVPKVIDFGIAKATQGELTDKTVFTQFQQFIGTPAYISPEQAEMSGLDIDTRADIYSLGVLLYELLVGQTPFDAKEMMQGGLDALRQIIREKEPLRPSTKLSQTLVAADVRRLNSKSEIGNPKSEIDGASSRRLLRIKETITLLRGDLDWIVMKCLEKDRTRRYDTANGLASDIQRHLNDEAVLARPPSAAYRFQKMVRRNKLAFATAGAVTLTLIAGLSFSTLAFLRERKANAGEKEQRLAAETEQQRADAQARKASESQQHSRRLLYASDMNLAQQALKMNNLGKARRLLDRHRPSTLNAQPSTDLRGWEWRYLWQLTRSSAFILTNRPVRGSAVSFSPDGTRLAVGWYDGRVDLWDVPGRRWVRALMDRESRYGGRVAFSPVRNLLVTTSEPKVVLLHDIDSGRESILWRAPDQGNWDIKELVFSQDGSKVVIYAGSKAAIGDAVWVVNVASSQIESHHPTLWSNSRLHGSARLSPDNRRLYVARSDSTNNRYNIQCLDLSTSQELWQSPYERDYGLTTLAISPDGQVLASGSGFDDSSIRVWDATTGRFILRLDEHMGYVCRLEFTKDGRRLISAGGDHSIRFWDTSTWKEIKVLRGHTDEVHAATLSESIQLLASTGKDGNLMLWKEDQKSTAEGHRRLPEFLPDDPVLPLHQSRVLLLPPDRPPEVFDLTGDSAPVSLPEIGSSADVLGWFGTNILCQWNGTNQILIREWRVLEFIPRGAITLNSGIRPAGLAYSNTRRLMAWSEKASSMSIHLANLTAPGSRIELRGDVPGLLPFRFSEDGNHLMAWTKGRDSLRVWNVATAQIVASISGNINDSAFAAGGRVLVVAMAKDNGRNHEIRFYDLTHPDRAPQNVPGGESFKALAVSPDGGLVVTSTVGGQLRLFDPLTGEFESLYGPLHGGHGVAFSPDGRRLVSTSAGREGVRLWDVATRQELLTLSTTVTGSLVPTTKWSADGDMILAAGAPWLLWHAPSWEEIAAAEAKEKTESKKP